MVCGKTDVILQFDICKAFDKYTHLKHFMYMKKNISCLEAKIVHLVQSAFKRKIFCKK